jgi:hypothetical protein
MPRLSRAQQRRSSHAGRSASTLRPGCLLQFCECCDAKWTPRHTVGIRQAAGTYEHRAQEERRVEHSDARTFLCSWNFFSDSRRHKLLSGLIDCTRLVRVSLVARGFT